MTLFPHQAEAKQFLLGTKRAMLCDSPRVGKTLPTASAALEHLPALIVCPAIVKGVWAAAIEKLDPTKSVRIVNGRKDAETIGGADVVIMNYDVLSNIKSIAKFQTLVLDESHRIKSIKAKRTEAALKLMARIPRVYALSGTPMPNRPAELYPILHGLGIYRGGFYDYAARYCRMWQAPWGLDVSGATNLPELRNMVAPYMLRRKKEDVFIDYTQPQVSLITFDLPVDRQEQEFDADALVDHPNPMLAFEGLATIMKEAGLRKVKSSIEFIADLLESGEKVVAFAHHKEVVHAIKDGLKNQGARISVITGETNQKYRADIIKQFQEGDNNLFLGNLAACQEGIDLSAADTVVFIEATWQTSALEQASSRIENISKQGSKPLVYLLTIAKSLDHVVLKKVLKKQNIIDQII